MKIRGGVIRRLGILCVDGWGGEDNEGMDRRAGFWLCRVPGQGSCVVTAVPKKRLAFWHSLTAQGKLPVWVQGLSQKSQMDWNCYVAQAGLELLTVLLQHPESHHF